MQGIAMDGFRSRCLKPVYFLSNIRDIVFKMSNGSLDHHLFFRFIVAVAQCVPVVEFTVHGSNYRVTVMTGPGFGIIEGKCSALGMHIKQFIRRKLF